MHDRHESQDCGNGRDLPHRDAAGDSSLADRPLADREVPLPGASADSSMALHAWLDGDLAEGEARRADQRQVEFWNRLNSETERRRRMTTPAHVADRIMAALPDKQVAMRTSVEPMPGKGIAPMMVCAIGTGLFAVGVVVGRLIV